MNSTRLVFADGLRGLAALWVVLFHMAEGGHLPSLKAYFPSWLWVVVFDWGHLGVPIFFVLSGFVMAWTARRLLFDAGTAVKFVLRRLIRLSPPYYFAILVAIAFMQLKHFVLGGVAPAYGFLDILSHVFYAQLVVSAPTINVVFWTLCIEIQFYIAFAILLYISDRFGFPGFRSVIICLAATIALLWPLGILQSVVWQGGFLGFWYAFLAGVLACMSLGQQGFIKIYLVMFCAVLLMLGLNASEGFTVSVATVSFLLMAAGNRSTLDKWMYWRWIQFFGVISYSLYLLHNPLTGASFRALNRLLPPGIWTELIAALATFVVCIAASWLAYRFVEKPSIQWSHRIRINRVA